jgi:hypothetical protein
MTLRGVGEESRAECSMLLMENANGVNNVAGPTNAGMVKSEAKSIIVAILSLVCVCVVT